VTQYANGFNSNIVFFELMKPLLKMIRAAGHFPAIQKTKVQLQFRIRFPKFSERRDIFATYMTYKYSTHMVSYVMTDMRRISRIRSFACTLNDNEFDNSIAQHCYFIWRYSEIINFCYNANLM